MYPQRHWVERNSPYYKSMLQLQKKEYRKLFFPPAQMETSCLCPPVFLIHYALMHMASNVLCGVLLLPVHLLPGHDSVNSSSTRPAISEAVIASCALMQPLFDISPT